MNTDPAKLIERLKDAGTLSEDEWVFLISKADEKLVSSAAEEAVKIRRKHFGNEVYVRGLIEFSNFCKNDCYYCGIRRSNKNAQRYRLDEDEILFCCRKGYELGFRTFVLQSGEDPYFTDDKICHITDRIKTAYPDCALTLSIGEKSRASYQAYFDAGAERYLLRHETADPGHYSRLHPTELSSENRKRCLYDLKDIGYQTGAGFMVGSPGQGAEQLAKDMIFLSELKPQMVGIGPFIPHKDTPFCNEEPGSLKQTLYLLSLIRLMLPTVLLPATTALGTIHPRGREMGILSGANVVMPNLSPVSVRKKYELYDNKICTGEESAECRTCLDKRMGSIGYKIVSGRGDHPDFGR